MAPVIALLTDFGTEDHYIGAVKGAILSLAPDAVLVDISHQVEPFSVSQGAFLLLAGHGVFPKGTIFLAVVDPGVGGQRAALVVEAGEWLFVGPDNGLLTPTVEQIGAYRAFAVDAGRLGLQPHPTFHARDLFGPVAAMLARGAAPEEVGPPAIIHGRMPWGVIEEGGVLKGKIIHRDHFGSLITSIPNPSLEPMIAAGHRRFRCRIGGREAVLPLSKTYCSVAKGAPTLIQGSSGFVEVAVNRGSAAQYFSVGVDDPVEIEGEAG